MFLKDFKNLSRKDIAIAGGKGASLGEMTRKRFPVPPGFVILASEFESFLAETDLNVEIKAAIKTLNHQDIHSVEAVSEKIRDLIADAEFPKDIEKEIRKAFKTLGADRVAVRSSATAEDSAVASWAGELESFLNISEKKLFETIKKCWSSLFTPRAIVYRFEKRLQDQKVSVAVVIQKMINSETSGICFTAHPVTSDRSQLVIEAGFGLGEAIVGGMITPDTYILKKPNFEILDINVAKQDMMIVQTSGGTKQAAVPINEREKQKLPGGKIVELAKICLQIEKHYKKPQDIEWALEGGKIFITQSRPITTL